MRVFEVKTVVGDCGSCPYCCTEEYHLTSFCSVAEEGKEVQVYVENRDGLAPSCPMFSKSQEAE